MRKIEHLFSREMETKALKRSIFLTSLLAVYLVLSGCTSVEHTIEQAKELTKATVSQKSKPERDENNIQQNEREITSNALSKGFEGSWVVELTCDSKNRRNYRVKEYGLLEISKNGGSKYEADFYSFEERKEMQNSPLNLKNGTFIRMQGRSQNGDTEIQLDGQEWLLKSTRNSPISFHGALQKNNFFIKGKVLGDPSCSVFIASRFSVNDTIEKTGVFSMGESGFLDMFTIARKRNRNPLDPQRCIDIFKWIGSGRQEIVIKRNRQSPKLAVNSLFFDEESFIRHLGKTYRNWTQKDAKAYIAFIMPCRQNSHQWLSPETERGFRTISLLGFLKVGKDEKNWHGSLINPLARNPFDRFKTPLPNMSWAGNYFVLAAVKSAKTYEQLLLHKLKNLDSSDKSVRTIKNHIEHDGFPLQFLPASNKNHFRRTVTALYKARENQNSEKALLAFNPAQYSKTLQGLKTLLSESKTLRETIEALRDRQKSDDLNSRYDAMINDHSLAAGHEIIDGAPTGDLSPDGYIKLRQYVRKAGEEELKYLRKKHQGKTKEQLNDVLNTFLTQFYSGMDQWVDVHVPSGDEGIDKLNELSKTFFYRDFWEREQNSHSSGVEKQIAEKILAEAEIRQDDCDQLAAHPQDKKKPYHIVGVSDELLNQDAALEACITSIEREIDNPRFNFQLGRVLFVSQLYEEALPYLEQEAKNNYGAANYYLGMMRLEGYAGLTKDVDEAIVWFEQSANAGFVPAMKFVQNYRSNLANLKREKEKITNATYNYPKIINSYITGKIERASGYSLQMLFTMKLLKELHGWCPDFVSDSDVKRMAQYLKSPNAEGYLKSLAFLRTPIQQGGRFSPNIDYYPYKIVHPNNQFDNEKVDDKISTDIYTMWQKYKCFNIEIEDFAKNAKNYMDTAPPYNLTSQPFWNACMKSSSGKMAVPKSQFCGCFLRTSRKGNISEKGLFGRFGVTTTHIRYFAHSDARELLNNFWQTAQRAIKKIPSLKACTLR